MTDAELLARIDERTETIKEKVEKIETHLEKLNGTIEHHDSAIILLKAQSADNRKWLIYLTTGLIAVVGGVVFVVLKHVGLQ